MFTTVIRIIILYLLITAAMRLMGKRQIGEMQPAELVVTLLVSEIAAIPIQDSSKPVLSAVLAIAVLTAVEIAITVLTLKSSFINSITNGKAAIIIKDGVILQSRLKRLRVTVSDLIELLRQQGVFDIREVSYAVLETNGTLSVLQKPDRRNASVADVKGEPQGVGSYPALVVSDGELVKRGLEDIDVTEADVLKQLKSADVDVADVFIMTLDALGNRVIIKKE